MLISFRPVAVELEQVGLAIVVGVNRQDIGSGRHVLSTASISFR